MAYAKKVPFKPWETKKADGIEKRYCRIADSQLMSSAMTALSNSAFRTYIHMRMESKGKMQFEFPRRKYIEWMSPPTFYTARDELVEKGFIEVVQNNRNLRKPNIYRFGEGWKSYIPPPEEIEP